MTLPEAVPTGHPLPVTSSPCTPSPRPPLARRVSAAADSAFTRWFSTHQMSYRVVARLMVPVVVAQVFLIGYQALSPLLVAGVGPAAINAVSTVGYLNLFLLSVYLAFASAGSVVVAHQAGRGDRDGVRQAAGVTMWVSLVPATLIAVVLLLAARPVSQLLLGPAGPVAVGFGHVYLTGLAISYPAQAMVDGASAALRGVARTAPALWLTIVGNGVFLLAGFLLSMVAGLGVWGLAVGGVIGAYLAAGLAVWFVQRDAAFAGQGPQWWPVAPGMARTVGSLGVPFVIEQVFFNGGRLIMQLFVVGMGTLAITANAVVNSLVAASEILPQALCVGIVPIVGQSLGAGHPDDARRLTRSFGATVVVTGVLGCVPILLCFGWVLDLFHTPGAVRHEVFLIFLLTTIARFVGVWSGSWLTPCGLRAAGDARYTTTVASVAMGLRLVFIWLVAVQLHQGLLGVWCVILAEWCARALFYQLRLRGDSWLRRSPVAGA